MITKPVQTFDKMTCTFSPWMFLMYFISSDLFMSAIWNCISEVCFVQCCAAGDDNNTSINSLNALRDQHVGMCVSLRLHHTVQARHTLPNMKDALLLSESFSYSGDKEQRQLVPATYNKRLLVILLENAHWTFRTCGLWTLPQSKNMLYGWRVVTANWL